jgi:hypothetical protein
MKISPTIYGRADFHFVGKLKTFFPLQIGLSRYNFQTLDPHGGIIITPYLGGMQCTKVFPSCLLFL